MPVTEVTSLAQLLQLVDKAPTIVDFTAVWCPPCQAIKGPFHSFSDKYPTVQFLSVDVDQVPDASQRFQISAMPTFIGFKAGQKVNSFQGANQAKLEETIRMLAN